MQEIWKDILGYEGCYQVSNLGNIKSLSRNWIDGDGYKRQHQELIMKSAKDSKGYLRINLLKNRKNKTCKVHRLVLSAFVGFSNLQVNHKNGIKADNRLENLEYCTNSENQLHAYKYNLKKAIKGESHPLHKLTESDVKQIIKMINLKIQQKEISRIFNISMSTISAIKTNKMWKHVAI